MDPVNNASRGPWISLDAGRQSTQYGTWIWYRFLTERHNDAIIKQIWVKSVGKANYSFKSIAAILVARGTSLNAMLALFGSWNAAPASFYTEGARYPTAGAIPGRDGTTRTGRAEGVTWGLEHRSTSRTTTSSSPAARRLRRLLTVTINFPSGVGAATAVQFAATGAVTPIPIALNANGDGQLLVTPFDASVSKIVVVVTNAGNRFVCNQGTIFSCSGNPLDDYLNGEFVSHGSPPPSRH